MDRKPIRYEEGYYGQRRCVGADCGKPCLAEGNLPSVAHHKVHSQHCNGVDDREAENEERIIGQKQRGGRASSENEHHGAAHHVSARRRSHARFPSAAPKIPCGFTVRTKTSTTKE